MGKLGPEELKSQILRESRKEIRSKECSGEMDDRTNVDGLEHRQD